MEIILFNSNLNSLLYFIGICLIYFVSYLLSLLGKQIKSGFTILKYIKQHERLLKAKGQSINNEKKILTEKSKAKRKIYISIIVIIVFQIIALIFIPTLNLKLLSLLFIIPVILGFLGMFLVPF